jgi:hypothetical protein
MRFQSINQSIVLVGFNTQKGGKRGSLRMRRPSKMREERRGFRV